MKYRLEVSVAGSTSEIRAIVLFIILFIIWFELGPINNNTRDNTSMYAPVFNSNNNWLELQSLNKWINIYSPDNKKFS